MRPANVSGIVTRHASVSYWLISFLFPSNSPRNQKSLWKLTRPSFLLVYKVAKLPVRLGRCYVELHYGTVLWILSLLLLAVRVRRETADCSSCETFPWANRSYAIPVFARNVIQSNPALRIPHYYVRTEYFMESSGVRYLRSSSWRISNRTWNRTSERTPPLKCTTLITTAVLVVKIPNFVYP